MARTQNTPESGLRELADRGKDLDRSGSIESHEQIKNLTAEQLKSLGATIEAVAQDPELGPLFAEAKNLLDQFPADKQLELIFHTAGINTGEVPTADKLEKVRWLGDIFAINVQPMMEAAEGRSFDLTTALSAATATTVTPVANALSPRIQSVFHEYAGADGKLPGVTDKDSFRAFLMARWQHVRGNSIPSRTTSANEVARESLLVGTAEEATVGFFGGGQVLDSEVQNFWDAIEVHPRIGKTTRLPELDASVERSIDALVEKFNDTHLSRYEAASKTFDPESLEGKQLALDLIKDVPLGFKDSDIETAYHRYIEGGGRKSFNEYLDEDHPKKSGFAGVIQKVQIFFMSLGMNLSGFLNGEGSFLDKLSGIGDGEAKKSKIELRLTEEVTPLKEKADHLASWLNPDGTEKSEKTGFMKLADSGLVDFGTEPLGAFSAEDFRSWTESGRFDQLLAWGQSHNAAGAKLTAEQWESLMAAENSLKFAPNGDLQIQKIGFEGVEEFVDFNGVWGVSLTEFMEKADGRTRDQKLLDEVFPERGEFKLSQIESLWKGNKPEKGILKKHPLRVFNMKKKYPETWGNVPMNMENFSVIADLPQAFPATRKSVERILGEKVRDEAGEVLPVEEYPDPIFAVGFWKQRFFTSVEAYLNWKQNN